MSEGNPMPFFPSNAPDYRGGYLRVPLSLWLLVYCQAPLTRREIQLVSVVLRESWGWRSKDGRAKLWTRPLKPGKFAALTGLSTDRIGKDLAGLVERGVLLEQDGSYQLVPFPQLWQPRPSKGRAIPPNGREPAAETALPRDCNKERKENLKKRSEREGWDHPPTSGSAGSAQPGRSGSVNGKPPETDQLGRGPWTGS